MALANSCCVIGRPRPRREPSTARSERSLLPRVIGELTYCNLQITYYFLLFVSRKTIALFSILYSRVCDAHGWIQQALGRAGESSVRLAQRLQVNSQLLALLVQVAALQTQRSRNFGHVKIVPLDFRQQHLFFKGFAALCEGSRSRRAGTR